MIVQVGSQAALPPFPFPSLPGGSFSERILPPLCDPVSRVSLHVDRREFLQDTRMHP